MEPEHGSRPAAGAAPPAGTRRRGAVLEQAIYDAVLAELADGGFGRLTMDGIARRAETPRTTLYRRWSSPDALVLDALGKALPAPTEAIEPSDLREDLITVLRRMSAVLAGPAGPAFRALIAEQYRHPELIAAIRGQILDPLGRLTVGLLHGYAEAGAIPAAVITPITLGIGPAIVLTHYLTNGTPPTASQVAEIVDQAVLPALQPPSLSGRRSRGTRAER